MEQPAQAGLPLLIVLILILILTLILISPWSPVLHLLADDFP
jgi:Tfp pilus assembly protein PilX